MRLLFILVLLLIPTSLVGQTFVLQPAKAENSRGDYVTSLLLKPDEVVRLNWTEADGSTKNLNGLNAKLVIGRSSNNYTTLEVDVNETREDLIPSNIGLAPGRYYARITNSTERVTSEIQADFNENPSSIIYSNEILLLVEAQQAPTIISPRGEITNPTPTFQWSAVSGVPSYWLILSSTPFDIVTDENGDISIEGATIVWQYITKNTTAEYGAINEQSPFTDEAPPLSSGQEYSYTILNVYEDNNPAFTSPIFGGIVPFIYSDPSAVPATTLQSPVSDEQFFSEENITFSWTEVPQAVNYTINLLQIVRQQGVDVTIPIWNSTTTNNIIEYPAIENLKNGRYQWYVISNNSTGGGTSSNSRFFNYTIETGELAAQIRSSVDNSTILGVELRAQAISGGVSPSLPFYVQTATHTDSLVVGRYRLTATKEGYKTGTAEVVINDDRRTTVQVLLEPLPSSIQGIVKDENGENVDNARIVFTNILNRETEEAFSDINGEFSIFVEEGTYTITVSKSGYISPLSIQESVGLDEQKTLSSPLILTNDQATVSGTVFNEDGAAIQRANVVISNGTDSYSTKTNGNGVYQFTVASGDWEIDVEKIGFIQSDPEEVSLSTGDIQQGINFILTGNANQVTGFVRERITNEDGSTGTTAFSDILVTAVPNVGSPVTTRTASNGYYTLSLKSGSYTIVASEENYSATEERELVIGIAVGETISGMDFELIPNPSSISGTVTTPGGEGVSDALVQINGSTVTQTSASGYYQVSVPSGVQVVSVSKTGLVTPNSKTVSVSVGQNLTGVDFEMIPNAGSVSGRIFSDGEALSNVTLTAVNATNGNTSSVTNNLDGRYTFNLRSGLWYIRAMKNGFITDSTNSINIGPGQQVINQNLSLVENLTTVRGTVTNGLEPVRNATITVTTPQNPSFNRNTISQLNGSYAFSLPAGRTYTFTASREGYRTAVVTGSELVPSTTVTIDLEITENPSSIAGTVSINGDGVLNRAKIVAINQNSIRVDSTESNNSGTYSLGLDPGTYNIEVSKPGYVTKFGSTTLSIGQNISGVNYVLDENFVFVSGSIFTSEGAGIEQVFVNLERNGFTEASTTTDQDGGFSFSGLIGGSYSLVFSRSGYISKTLIRNANDGDFISLADTLIAKVGSIEGVIRDENGIALSEATVTSVNLDGVEYSAITNNQGVYTLQNLEPSTYEVNASKTGFTTSDPTITDITEQALNRTNIDVTNLVPNNGAVEGVITNSSTNEPIKDVEILIVGERGSGFALTNSSGAFSVTNLIPDSYTMITSKLGFKSDTTTLSIDPVSPTENVNRSIIQNNGTITGRVVDPSGEALPFNVTLIATSTSNSYTTRSIANGEFSFDGIETGENYTIRTDIYREGYENVQTSLAVDIGQDAVALTEDLKVIVEQGVLNGTTTVPNSTVKLLDGDSLEIISIINADTDGNYEFDLLSEGVYRIVAQRLGYIFSPDTTNRIQLGFDETKTNNFSAVENIATLTVEVLNEDNSGASGVDVTIISADTSIILNDRTDINGLATFSDIEATTFYVVRPEKEGFTASPESKEITLVQGDSLATTFTLLANGSSFSGTVYEGNSPVNQATVTAIFTTTGQNFEALTNRNGDYSFEDLASGNYLVVAERSGFVADSVELVVNPGQSARADTLQLSRASVRLRGFVKLKGEPVEGVEVTATSSSTFETVTNSSGAYTFTSVPIRTSENDTTIYQVRIVSGLFTKSYILELTPDQIGRQVTLPETNLPSGQINITVTDGANPIDGAEVLFGISGGEIELSITGENGQFSSSDNLRQATYAASATKTGFLFPENTVDIVLPSDTTILNEELFLPYTLQPVEEILADQATKVVVTSTSEYDNSLSTGILFYKKASDISFSEVPLVLNGDSLEAEIPALNSTEVVTLYTEIEDAQLGNRFISNQQNITPLASGILSNFIITPTISGTNLRAGDTYTLELSLRDGINQSMQEDFEGENPTGTITWEIISDSNGISLLSTTGITNQLEAQIPGNYTIQVTASLEGVVLQSNLDIEVTSIPIQSINVSTPGTQLSNASNHLFSYNAIDTSGNSIVLGGSLEWNINPPGMGSISDEGVFTPTSTSMFGTFQVTVSDSISGISGTSEVVELVARIEPDESYTLTNMEGLELLLSPGSVDIPSQVSLSQTVPAKTKKFVFAQNSDNSYTVGDRIYILSLSGSDLKNTAQLSLPVDSSLSDLNTGERVIGRYNLNTLQWQILDNISLRSFNRSLRRNAGTIETNTLGQFAVMSQNQPITIRNAAVLPSPFSPDIAPLKIGYWLDTAFPPARVSVKIYNVRGELVRTIFEDDLQQPGRYGSTSSLKEITWDGRTNNGNMALNGRYLIQIVAKDQQKEVEKIIQVVLIK